MTENPPDHRAWHALPVEEALSAFDSTAEGLSSKEAGERLERFGPNRLTPPARRGPWLRFLLQFHNVLIYALLVAALVTGLLGEWVDTGVILGVVVINALIGFIQEGKAEQALEAIRAMLSLRAMVLRDGQRREIDAQSLVVGDQVWLQSGDKVPADLRLIQVRNLSIQEAVLTGESVSVEKSITPVAQEAPLGDRRSMAYSGTLVSQGQGLGVVVATGDATQIGRISTLLREVETLETPLLRKMATFARLLTGAIIALAALVFAYGVLWQGFSPAEMFFSAVGLAVAAIPEGLPAIMTITLAIGVQRMSRRNAIIRRLPAVETLGSVTVICSDKTGTLTRNEMSVRRIVTTESVCVVEGVGYGPEGGFFIGGQPFQARENPLLLEIGRAGLLCNEASLIEDAGQWRVDGDPTEGALLALALRMGLDRAFEQAERPRTDVIPFESEHRFMATLHHDHAGHGFVYLKGAPEAVLAICTQERFEGVDRPLDPGFWHAAMERAASDGLRVLAVAFRSASPQMRTLRFADVDEGYTLLGLVCMADPPRPEAIEAVARCHAAGVRVKMITGDHAVTARAIGEQLGLATRAGVLTGSEVEALDDARLREVVRDCELFARASPEHKLRLVEALQANGAIVAMTGDGVNDAPALKRADVGVAMGQKGTEAAKEAAEMVLADDNFASITDAVEEGRTVYDNLRKSIAFILPTNIGQAMVIVAAILMGLTLPILPAQILWVNMVTAVTLAMALAFEPAESDVMQRPPRAPDEPLLSRFLLWRTLFVSVLLVVGSLGLFLWMSGRGEALEVARTAAVNALIVGEIFYLFNCRYLLRSSFSIEGLSGNRYVLVAIAFMIVLQAAFTYAPFMNLWFRTAPLPADAWGGILFFGLAVYVILELEKWLARKRRAGAG